MAKSAKNFDTIQTTRATGTDAVQAEIKRSATSGRGRQSAASASEQKERASTMRTQGRKGCKADRVNIAMTPENEEFVRILSRAAGKSRSEIINTVLNAYRREHRDLYDNALDLAAALEATVQGDAEGE